MSKSIKRRRGTAVEHQTFVGLDGEITVDTTSNSIRVHDNSTAGGFETARADGSNIHADTIDINGGTIDGAVIGANVPAAITGTDLAGTSLDLSSSTVINSVLDEDNFSSNSATALATQQSIKAYVDSQVGTVDTLAEILANGNTTGANDIDVDAAQKVQFRDAAIYINSSADGQLDIVADTEIQIAATTVDINGAVDVSGTLGVTGVATLASLVATTADINGGTIDNTVIGGTTAAAGSFTTGAFSGEIAANGGIALGDNDKATFGAGALEIYHDGSNSYIKNSGTGNLYIQDTDYNGDVYIQAQPNENSIIAYNNSSVVLFFDNAQKIMTTATGIDVTGTVTADGLTVSDGTETTSIPATADRVSFTGATSNFIQSSTSLFVQPTGDLVLNGTGSEIMRLKSSKVGINNSNPATALDVTGTATMDGLVVDGESDLNATVTITHANPRIKFIENDTSNANTQFSNDGGDFAISTMNDAESAFTKRFNLDHATGDISFFEDTGTTPKLTWSASGETLNFADNVKATFGAGDLQIYHDGSNSYIDEQGTGILKLRGSAGIALEKYDSTEQMLTAFHDDAVTLFHNGSSKLATTATGIDISGTATMDGLVVDGNTQVNSVSAAASGTRSIQFYRDSVERGAVRFDYSASTMELQADGNFFVSTGGESTRLFVSNNGNVSLYEDTGTTPKFVWDASAESLGIGTSSPYAPLTVRGTGDQIILDLNTSTNGDYSAISWNTSTSDLGSVYGAEIRGYRAAAGAYGALAFHIRPNGEAMRIDSSGNLLVGTTDSTPNGLSVAGAIVALNDGTRYAISLATSTSATSTAAAISNTNGLVGTITTDGSSTAYNTSSDQRLKENIADADDAGSKIDAIQVRKFDWKVDGSHQDYGMVAQELMIVAPEAVSAPEDPEEMMGVDYSKLVPMLIKEIQSLRNRVAQLEG